MAKNTVFLAIVVVLVIHGLIFTNGWYFYLNSTSNDKLTGTFLH